MDMHQPDTGVKLPKDVQLAVEAARNNVTMLEAESVRLSKLVITEQKEVNSLHSQHVDYGKRIAVAVDQLAGLQSDIEDASAKKQALEDKSAAITKDNAAKAKALDEAEVHFAEREHQLSQREADMKAREQKLAARSEEVSTHHEAVNTAKNTLKAAIESITL